MALALGHVEVLPNAWNFSPVARMLSWVQLLGILFLEVFSFKRCIFEQKVKKQQQKTPYKSGINAQSPPPSSFHVDLMD